MRVARQLPGVRAVLALNDLRPVLARTRMPLGFRSSKLPPNVTPHVLADRDVAFVGQVVAMVIAEMPTMVPRLAGST